MELACSWIAKPCMDTYVTFFLGALETFTQLGDIILTGNMEVGCLLVSMPCFGGCVLGILEEGFDP